MVLYVRDVDFPWQVHEGRGSCRFDAETGIAHCLDLPGFRFNASWEEDRGQTSGSPPPGKKTGRLMVP